MNTPALITEKWPGEKNYLAVLEELRSYSLVSRSPGAFRSDQSEVQNG